MRKPDFRVPFYFDKTELAEAFDRSDIALLPATEVKVGDRISTVSLTDTYGAVSEVNYDGGAVQITTRNGTVEVAEDAEIAVLLGGAINFDPRAVGRDRAGALGTRYPNPDSGSEPEVFAPGVTIRRSQVPAILARIQRDTGITPHGLTVIGDCQ